MRTIVAASLIAAAGIATAANPTQPAAMEAVAPVNETQRKKVKRQVVAGHLDPGWRKSKNAPTKRRLRANRNHISRRVRRKHRRAA